MTKRYLSLPAFALLAMMALPAGAQNTDLTSDTVVATVNGTDITIGHMIVARNTLPQQYQELPDDVLFQGIFSQLIDQTVLSQSFEGKLPNRSRLSLENETRSITAAEAVELVLADAFTEDDVQAAYEAELQDFSAGEEYNASHILVETEEAALAVIAELEEGADFAATARERSTGPSGPNGGSLGWFGTGAMVPAFEAAVIALEVGGVSAPVETQFGWHVIMLNETRKLAAPTIDELRPQLVSDLRNAALEARLETLKAEGTIDTSGKDGIDPAVIKDLSLLQ